MPKNQSTLSGVAIYSIVHKKGQLSTSIIRTTFIE